MAMFRHSQLPEQGLGPSLLRLPLNLPESFALLLEVEVVREVLQLVLLFEWAVQVVEVGPTLKQFTTQPILVPQNQSV